jgi:hypothetical protein
MNGNSNVWIDNAFPSLSDGRYIITSGPSVDYNCIAWAVGDTTAWWCHLPGYRWPNVERNPTVENLVAMFAKMGYQICDSACLENGFEKVALYEKAGLWTHASRQLPNGRWSSKLGREEDIEHAMPDDLSGVLYGTVHCIMRKRR